MSDILYEIEEGKAAEVIKLYDFVGKLARKVLELNRALLSVKRRDGEDATE